MTSSFIDKLQSSIEENDSLLCVGLDPDPSRMPADFHPDLPEGARMLAFCRDIIELTADLVCCYKPNAAFFEQAGPEGLAALRDVVGAVPKGIPVLLDAKRGDIGNTAKAYARAAFEMLGADAITVSPYLGEDSVRPFLAYEDKAVFLLCHTSNPSAVEIQHHGTPPLYQQIVRQGQAWGGQDQLGFVVGATQPGALKAVRRLAPDRWLLVPGVGAQGGDLDATLEAGLTVTGAGGAAAGSAEYSGVIVPVSRGVLYAPDPRAAAHDLRARINVHRREQAPESALALDLFEAGCVRFGQFTLASGQVSPIYVDLRRVISFPALFEKVVNAYAGLVKDLVYDRLAAVPYAALPVASALAIKLKRSLIYPRKEAKGHGTGQAIEGSYESGQLALVVEDVVTSGGSLLQAVSTLEAAGLKVQDVVVLVDREQGGGARLAADGRRLHAVLTLDRLLAALRDAHKIDAATDRQVRSYLGSQRGSASQRG